MSSEKTNSDTEQTKDYSNRAFTLAGRVATGLAAANIPPEVMKFFIDSPRAVNNLCKAFAEKPLTVEAYVIPPSIAGGVVGLIEGVYTRFNIVGKIQKCGIYPIQIYGELYGVDVAITDHPSVCNELLLIKAKRNHQNLEVIYVNNDEIVSYSKKEKIIVKPGFNKVGDEYFTSDSPDKVLNHLLLRQINKILGPVKRVAIRTVPTVEGEEDGSLCGGSAWQI